MKLKGHPYQVSHREAQRFLQYLDEAWVEPICLRKILKLLMKVSRFMLEIAATFALSTSIPYIEIYCQRLFILEHGNGTLAN